MHYHLTPRYVIFEMKIIFIQFSKIRHIFLSSQAKDYIPTLSIKDDFDNDIIEDSKTKVKNEFSNGEVVAGHGNHDGQNEVEEEEDYKTQNDFEQMVIGK